MVIETAFMTNGFKIKTNSFFKSLTYDPDANSWYFVFAENIAINTESFWRILKNKKILFVSLDHGHKFGLPEPVDLAERINECLKGRKLTKITVIQDTADLLLTLTDNFQIEIFISSSGYESYNFSINNRVYIGLGSGDIAYYDN